jgi:hypothetical protein
MYLRNKKVYFQKDFNHPLSIPTTENRLKTYNTPYGGLQIKLENENTIKGVLLNYQLNWMIDNDKKFQVPPIFKKPLNASFEIKNTNNSYNVIVENIWITTEPKGKQHNQTIESIVAKKDGCCFLKNKKNIRILELIDKNFSQIFLIESFGGELRF